MSNTVTPLSQKWIIRILVVVLVVSALIGGYYHVRFELLERQIQQGDYLTNS